MPFRTEMCGIWDRCIVEFGLLVPNLNQIQQSGDGAYNAWDMLYYSDDIILKALSGR